MPEARILARKSNMVWGNAFLSPMGDCSFEVIGYRKPQRGRVWEGVSSFHGGDFFGFRCTTKPGFECIIKYMIAV